MKKKFENYFLFQKGNVPDHSAGISEIDLSKLSVRESKEDGKRKPLGEVNRTQVVDRKSE